MPKQRQTRRFDRGALDPGCRLINPYPDYQRDMEPIAHWRCWIRSPQRRSEHLPEPENVIPLAKVIEHYWQHMKMHLDQLAG